MGKRTEYQHGEFSWADLMTGDVDKAKAFYGNVFGWTAEDQDTQGGPLYVQFYLDGNVVAGLGEMNPDMKAAGAPPVWNTYVTVDNIDNAVDKAQTLGASLVMPVMDVLDVGRMSILQDPEGAYISLWESRAHIGAAVTHEPGSWGWFELATRGPEAARDFYAELFGWTYRASDQSPTSYSVIQAAETEQGGMIEMNEEWGDMPPCWGVYFVTADIDTTVARVTECGGRIDVPPFEIPGVGKIAVAFDDQGAFFCLMQRIAAA